MSAPAHSRENPWEKIPARIAVCPECGAALYVNLETGEVECDNEPDDLDDDAAWDRYWMFHRWWQSTWQPVLDHVRAAYGITEIG